MNTKTKILLAFTVGTLGGAVLGSLLNSREIIQSSFADERKLKSESFLRRLFSGKKRSDLNQSMTQNAQEYEDA